MLHLAWPILIAQLLSMTMMVADTVIAGRYGTADLAGVAIGSSYYISVVMLLTGTLQAVAPTVAHHVGARRQEAIGPALQQGFWLALLLAVPGVALLLSPGYLLALADVPADVAAKAADYLAATAIGLPAVLFYRTFYAFNNAVGRPRVLMSISAIATSAHIPLAWALTNGALGFAPLGGTGCGLSTALVSWLALGCGFVYLVLNPAYRTYRIFHAWQPPQAKALGQLLRLGLPMGLSTFIVGILPTYASIGVAAPVILIILRMLHVRLQLWRRRCSKTCRHRMRGRFLLRPAHAVVRVRPAERQQPRHVRPCAGAEQCGEATGGIADHAQPRRINVWPQLRVGFYCGQRGLQVVGAQPGIFVRACDAVTGIGNGLFGNDGRGGQVLKDGQGISFREWKHSA